MLKSDSAEGAASARARPGRRGTAPRGAGPLVSECPITARVFCQIMEGGKKNTQWTFSGLNFVDINENQRE